MITQQAREQFLREGYLVVPDVVPRELREAVISVIREYTRRSDPSKNAGGHGIVPLHHHQALWDVRQHPAVYDVFRRIYQQDNLWVSMDRISFKPPAPASAVRAPIHWDCDPWSFNALSVQGLVYLTDTNPGQGAFTCVPSIYRNLAAWCSAHASDETRHRPQVDETEIVSVGGSAGSLVVFHRLMPHTSGVNRSGDYRFVQYVTMQPEGAEEERSQRVSEWREKMPPQWAIRQNIEGQEVPEPGDSATLSELGKKLVGISRFAGRSPAGSH